MDPFLKQIYLRAATFEEILSNEFEDLPGQKEHSNLAASRLAAWCQSTASGDWHLFSKRLKRDNLDIEKVLRRFSTVKPVSNSTPRWAEDMQWVMQSLETPASEFIVKQWHKRATQLPFQDLFLTCIEKATKEVTSNLSSDPAKHFSKDGFIGLQALLLKQLIDLSSPILFSLFIKHIKTEAASNTTLMIEATDNDLYSAFIQKLQDQGLKQLFIEKPVLLRLLASLIRQWITTTVSVLEHIESDFSEIISEFVSGDGPHHITEVIGDLSDAHNLGGSVLIFKINNLTKIVYKPKDLTLDIEWLNLINKLNTLNPPTNLKAVKTIKKNGYGWTEFVGNTPCSSKDEFALFFQRAGSWLALFHLFASSDMHFENLIANGAHPVPIDLEMILQATAPENELVHPEILAMNEANQKIANSVLMVGMLPAYARLPNNEIIDMGGLNAATRTTMRGTWHNVNTNAMRWSKEAVVQDELMNIPNFAGEYANLGDYLAEFVDSFETYSQFLLDIKTEMGLGFFLDSFKGAPVRKLIRPTRFYAMLMQRLKDYRSMDDGITWSLQADFLARLADWDNSEDIIWPLQQSERDALLNLNIPHFTTSSDDQEIKDINGVLMSSPALSGLDRAKERFNNLTKDEINWQKTVIELSTSTVSSSTKRSHKEKYKLNRILAEPTGSPDEVFLLKKCAQDSAQRIADAALKKGASVAWVGIDWLGDSEVAQLVSLGPDLYTGTSGIAFFLAARYKVCGSVDSKALAYKALASTRHQLKQNTAARWARSLGIGGASGLGSIIYALTTISQFLNDPELLEDALACANLISADMIAADENLDIIGGSAGAILALLKLHKVSGSPIALETALLCGEHLLKKPRTGEAGKRSWISPRMLSESPLNGMSHGASGFAYSLVKLYEISQRNEFLEAANECLEYEKSNYLPDHQNWGDLRGDGNSDVCQWCHGAIGIGLARLGIKNSWKAYREDIDTDISNSIEAASRYWPNSTDSLCCGTLGSIELINESGKKLNRSDLKDLARSRFNSLLADANKNGGFSHLSKNADFNLGLFRGESGVGYTALRQLDCNLPNVLLWE